MLMTLLIVQLVFIGGCALAVHLAALAAQTHATSAADAVAHAVVSELAADPLRGDLEVALQGGLQCSLTGGGSPPATVNGDANATCRSALAAGRQAAAANSATLISLHLGADPHAYVVGSVPAQFEALVNVDLAGPLAGTTALCADHQSRHDLCWANGWSAAREAG